MYESPYCYVGNNPISRIDPDGKLWKGGKDGENAKQAEADVNSLRVLNKWLSNRIAKYDQKIEKAKKDGNANKVDRLENKKSDANNRIVYNDFAIASIEKMGSDPDKVFRYGNASSSTTTSNTTTVTTTIESNVSRDLDGTYVINNTGSASNRIHESIHGGQIADNMFDVKVGTNKGELLRNNYPHITWGFLETQSYRAEYAFHGSVSAISGVKNLLEINESSIRNAQPKTY